MILAFCIFLTLFLLSCWWFSNDSLGFPAFMCTLCTGIIGAGLLIGLLVDPVEAGRKYEIPSSIMKTNFVTAAVFVDEGVRHTLHTNTAQIYNVTNLVVYGQKFENRVSVPLDTEYYLEVRE